ncbi:MAG: Bis(5'-nucleosyl)-tetraphosphatase (asymmetrical) [uncultured Chloroflexia bacterium]|uniref:Bis(5'-nucleosyl)-tetraphosphatase (Asymmetrical) n=1 Tax=uncultured Chloroflexia bacterium TaxID=1672391 RepID=A0A6J4KHQ5_9CHLR|nr:MAG: Bis(5'-nucleosyl)-tetraphosphatase (asymmetrical) [uncultured Chloroflexia bacterium]
MFSHAPEDYACPFCLLAGADLGSDGSNQNDVIYRDDEVTAFVASKWWPNNKGHVLVIPNAHYENIYDLPPALGAPIQRLARTVALAMKATYGCDGVSTRQHNEPKGGQDVWHYHLHVLPRYSGDILYLTRGRPTRPQERRPYAMVLRKHLAHE